MKKLLLLLLFFLSISINAQPPSNMPPYIVCETNSDGFAQFSLASQIPAILNGLNPNTTVVTFHETLSDSQAGANAITSINAYTNINPQIQTIYIRVVDNANSQTYYSTMDLVTAENANAGIDGSVTLCESSSTPIDLFSLITGEQPGGIWARSAGTGGTFNSVAGIYTTAPGATTSFFTYTVSSLCGNDTSMAIVNVTAQPYAGIDGTATICDNNPTNLNLFSLITGEQVGGTWVRTSGSGGVFNAAAGTYLSTVGATTSSFTYTIAGTAPCINDASVVTIITVNNCSSQTLCGGTFTDSGGPNSNYANNSNITTTICPDNPGDVVTVTFTSFNTEATSDGMYVYNGSTATAPLIPSMNAEGNGPTSAPGAFWGNTIPGPFTSSSLSGCLTFRFLSDSTNTLPGWVANVTCNPPGCSAPTNLAATNFMGTSAIFTWTSQGSSTAWEVLVLPFGSPAPTGSGIPTTSLSYNVTGLSPDECYVFYVRTVCQPQVSSEWVAMNLCMYNCENNASCPENLALIAFLDSNGNGSKDTGESAFNYGSFEYNVNSGIPIYGSNNNGAFIIFENNPANVYDLRFVPTPHLSPYYSSPTTYSNITVAAASGTNIYYFPVTLLQAYDDLEISITPLNNPRPGFTYTNLIKYRNKGSQTVPSGMISFGKPSQVTITSISQSGTTSQPSGFNYNYTNLAPGEQRMIQVTMQVPTIPTVNLNDILTCSAFIIPNTSDSFPSDNSASLSQVVVGSYDPNDKIESHGGKIVHSTFTANEYLYYTIQFENTGTANAEFIRVNDLLDNKLDENTFEMLNSSHTVRTKRDGKMLNWYFYDIDLPPTSSNPTASHGYVQFKIKPKVGYAIGDVIPNKASIFFDFNPPIVTDTFNTEFVPFLRNPTFNSNRISLSPNPASDIVTITNSNSVEKISKVVIYDITGKMIYNLSDNILASISINVSHFAKGIYLVELISDSNSKITKKLILK